MITPVYAPEQKPYQRRKSCHLILAANPPEHPQGDFSLSANGVLLPPHGDTYTYTGIGVFHPSLFEKLKAEEKTQIVADFAGPN